MIWTIFDSHVAADFVYNLNSQTSFSLSCSDFSGVGRGAPGSSSRFQPLVPGFQVEDSPFLFSSFHPAAVCFEALAASFLRAHKSMSIKRRLNMKTIRFNNPQHKLRAVCYRLVLHPQIGGR